MNMLVDEKGRTMREVPESLREGWEVFCAWASAREKAGDPLPPGGVFFINSKTVLVRELLAVRRQLANYLRIPLDCVKADIDPEPSLAGRLLPRFFVDPPVDWLQNFGAGQLEVPPGASLAKLATDHINAAINIHYRAAVERIAVGMAGVQKKGPHLRMPEVEDVSGSTTTQDAADGRAEGDPAEDST
jgi:hypothetical protein